MAKRQTAAEIAKLAGVSRSTVSRVINGYSNVPAGTRERVMKVIDEHGYVPQLSGQLLVGKSTRTLGFFWISNGGSIANDLQCSAFFVHVTEIAASLGYVVLTCIVDNLRDRQNIDWVRRIFLQGRVDAGILIGANDDEPLVEELIAKGKIVGVFDHHPQGRDEPNRLSVNFEWDTGERAIDYLVDLGHRDIAVIDGNLKRFSSMQRHESYLRGLRKHGLPSRPQWIIAADVNAEEGYHAATALLAPGGPLPTAICANTDATAFGVYRALGEAGFSIPGDVSVVGIDGHEGGLLLQPRLTTFVFDFEKIFRSLVCRTVAAAEQQPGVAATEFFTSQLVERESCRRIG